MGRLQHSGARGSRRIGATFAHVTEQLALARVSFLKGFHGQNRPTEKLPGAMERLFHTRSLAVLRLPRDPLLHLLEVPVLAEESLLHDVAFT